MRSRKGPERRGKRNQRKGKDRSVKVITGKGMGVEKSRREGTRPDKSRESKVGKEKRREMRRPVCLARHIRHLTENTNKDTRKGGMEGWRMFDGGKEGESDEGMQGTRGEDAERSSQEGIY